MSLIHTWTPQQVWPRSGIASSPSARLTYIFCVVPSAGFVLSAVVFPIFDRLGLGTHVLSCAAMCWTNIWSYATHSIVMMPIACT